jgi:Flp pilus assembly protein TadG
MMIARIKQFVLLHRQQRHDRGQALVELAVALPLLLLILVGGAEFARFAFAAIAVSNSARAAAQYAATNGGATTDTMGISNAAQSDSPYLSSAVTATVQSDVCVCSNDESTAIGCTTATLCNGSGHIMETVSIGTSSTYTPVFKIPGFSGPYTLKGYAQQMVLR